MKRFLLVLLGLTLLLVSGKAEPAASQGITTSLAFRPASQALMPGDTVTVELWVQDVEKLRAFDIEIDFDPSFLSVSQLENGGFLAAGLTPPTNEINQTLGIIRYGAAVVGSSGLKSGSGPLLRFEAAAKDLVGITTLRISSATLVGEAYFEIPLNQGEAEFVIGDVPKGPSYYLPLFLF